MGKAGWRSRLEGIWELVSQAKELFYNVQGEKKTYVSKQASD